MVRAAYLAMEFVGWFVIVPVSLAALLTGLVQSLGTEWGLFRHYWVSVKFLLTAVATIMLLLHMPTVSRMSGMAAAMTLPIADSSVLGVQLVLHAAGGLLVLLATTALSIFKPWGMTPFGQRKATLSIVPRRQTIMRDLPSLDRRSTTGIPRGLVVLFWIVGLVLLLSVLHLATGGLRHH